MHGISRTGVRLLTQAQAAEVIKLYDAGNHTQRELARSFGVSQGTISNIVTQRFYVAAKNEPGALETLIKPPGLAQDPCEPFY